MGGLGEGGGAYTKNRSQAKKQVPKGRSRVKGRPFVTPWIVKLPYWSGRLLRWLRTYHIKRSGNGSKCLLINSLSRESVLQRDWYVVVYIHICVCVCVSLSLYSIYYIGREWFAEQAWLTSCLHVSVCFTHSSQLCIVSNVLGGTTPKTKIKQPRQKRKMYCPMKINRTDK